MQKFISEMSSGTGLARPNRYGVRINTIKLLANPTTAFQFGILRAARLRSDRHLDIYCEEAELPGRSFATSEVRHYGPHFTIPYQPVYNSITLSFYVNDDMLERRFFDAWQNSVMNPFTKDMNFFDDYTTDIFVYQLSKTGELTPYVVVLRDAWPVNVNQMRLSYDETNTVHKLPVTFNYTKWENIEVSGIGFFDQLGSSLPNSIGSLNETLAGVADSEISFGSNFVGPPVPIG